MVCSKKQLKDTRLMKEAKLKDLIKNQMKQLGSQAEICLIGNIQSEKFINLEELKQLQNG